jgi:hypothetical protein
VSSLAGTRGAARTSHSNEHLGLSDPTEPASPNPPRGGAGLVLSRSFGPDAAGTDREAGGVDWAVITGEIPSACSPLVALILRGAARGLASMAGGADAVGSGRAPPPCSESPPASSRSRRSVDRPHLPTSGAARPVRSARRATSSIPQRGGFPALCLSSRRHPSLSLSCGMAPWRPHLTANAARRAAGVWGGKRALYAARVRDGKGPGRRLPRRRGTAPPK